MKTEIALYRPMTTKGGRRPGGDPRIRISGAPDYSKAGDVLVLARIGASVCIINWSDRRTRRSAKLGHLPIRHRQSRRHVALRGAGIAESLAGKVKKLARLSKAELFKRYGEDLARLQRPPKRLPTLVDRFTRSPIVVELTLRRTRGRCEVLGCAYKPFKRVDGAPYLEVHHLITLAEGGLDTLENTIGLCPSHHRELHLGRNAIKLRDKILADRETKVFRD